MINKELQNVINSEHLLERLATNLDIPVVNDNSSIKKIVDSFSTELLNYANATDTAISNSFITTMDKSLLETFAAGFGIYRKRFSTIRINSTEQIVTVSINDVIGNAVESILVFNKNDVIYSNPDITIITKEDITINKARTFTYVSVEIVLNTDVTDFTIAEGTVFDIKPTTTLGKIHAPLLDLNFNYTLGLAKAEEAFEDFRTRLIDNLHLSSNITNSLLTFVTKEVPMLYVLESDEVAKGRAITQIYPYTRNLVLSGKDAMLDTMVIPMVEASLNSKTFYKDMISVVAPKPIHLIVKYTVKDQPIINAILTDTIYSFNIEMFQQESFTVKTIKTVIAGRLSKYGVKTEDLDIYYVSSEFSEADLKLHDNEEVEIKTGRFLNLLRIEEK